MVVKERPVVKHVADIVGEWGKWQFAFTSFCFILWAAAAMNNMGYSFHAYNNQFWCDDVPEDYPNKTDSMKCSKFLNPNESCTQWTYDRTEFENSIITEFDLVCHRSNWASISQSIYMMGYAVSGLVFAHYSDKYGRKPIIWLCFVIEIISVLCCSLSVNIWMYVVSRFFVGMGASGRGMAVYTILLEICGPKYRSDIVILGGIGWVLGYALVPGLALWLQSFRYMQFISFIAMTLMMVWFYFLYESPRWQLTNGQIDRAEVTLRRALKMNGQSDEYLTKQLNDLSSYLKKVKSDEERAKTHTVLDLLKTPKLRKITLIFWYQWVVNALVYYGFSFNMSDFGGNFYITFLLSGLVELPSQLLSALFLRFIGRRNLFCSFMTLTGISCIAISLTSNESLKVAFALIGKFGVSSSWNVMGIHAPELFPTILRNTGIGAASVVGRIGSVSSPFMKNLAENYGLNVVMLLYAGLSILGAILGLFLPETKGKEIPDTIEEAEKGSLELEVINYFYFIQWIVGALNNIGYTFHAYNNDYWCTDVPQDYPNKTDSMKCSKFLNPNESCTEWRYDRTQFQNSITTEFDLVCDRSNIASVTQSIYMMGYIVAGLVFAHNSDKYGRRPIVWLCFVIEMTGILCCALSVNIYMYIVARFFVGMGGSGRGMAYFTILLEISGPKHRSTVVVLGGLGWVLGYALVPGVALWLQDFRSMTFLVFICSIFIIVWFYFLDESPRWQIANGHLDRAEVTLRRALKMNGQSDKDLKEHINVLASHLKEVKSNEEKAKKYNVLDLLKTPKLRKVTLIMWWEWIVNAMIYYGFSFNMSNFGGNFYLTFLLSGLVELPSNLLSALLLRLVGRRKLFFGFMSLTGLSCLAIIPSINILWLRVAFALIGKFGVTSAWSVMGIQGPELFPTILRNTGIGASSVVGRIGSVCAPFMKNLADYSGLSVVMALYATLSLIGGLLGLLLPETKGKEIPDTIEETEYDSYELKAIEN